jgi:hypothetical protein
VRAVRFSEQTNPSHSGTPKRKPPPISLNDYSQLLLRGLAGRFGFEHLLAAHVNFDLLWLGLGLLGELDNWVLGSIRADIQPVPAVAPALEP